MEKRLRILYITNLPSPYVVGYLNELGRYCNVKAVFEKAVDRTRPQSWRNTTQSATNFQFEILRGIPISSRFYGDDMGYAPDDKALAFSVVRHISCEYDLIILGCPCTPTEILAILYMRLRRIPYAIECEGGFAGSGKGVKERFKHFLMKKAVLYFSTCELGEQYFYRYGATSERMRRYIFTSMHEENIPKALLPLTDKEEVKRKLKIKSDVMILTVGRAVPFKGFDILLKAFQKVGQGQEAGRAGINLESCHLYLVGTECLPEYQKIICEDHKQRIHFVENLPFSELKEYYQAADIFVLPTRGDVWGLVINEAMAYGLPVITTDRCVAGSALVKDGVNGFIVPTDDIDALCDVLERMIADRILCKEMGERNFAKIKKYTLEEMGKIMYGNIKEYVGQHK